MFFPYEEDILMNVFGMFWYPYKESQWGLQLHQADIKDRKPKLGLQIYNYKPQTKQHLLTILNINHTDHVLQFSRLMLL